MAACAEHLVIEIHGKQLPYNAALGCDPYFQLVVDGKKGKDAVAYRSETVRNCFEPRWLAFDMYSNEVDFEKEFQVQVFDDSNFYVPKYIAETKFTPAQLRHQFTSTDYKLEDKTGEKRGDLGRLVIRRLVVKDHSSKNSNHSTVTELSNIEHHRSKEEKLSAFWTRTNAKREEEERIFLEKLRKSFDHFDIDGNGTIDRDEFMIILPEVWGGRTVTMEEVIEIISEVDINDDQVVDFEEFRTCVKVLDRRYEAILREERRQDRMRRLEEREKCEWDRQQEQMKRDVLQAQAEMAERFAKRESRQDLCDDPEKLEKMKRRLAELEGTEQVFEEEEPSDDQHLPSAIEVA